MPASSYKFRMRFAGLCGLSLTLAGCSSSGSTHASGAGGGAESSSQPGSGVLEEGDSFLDREQRLLVRRVAYDADDDRVEDRGRATDHVDVPERDGVERAGVDRDDRLAVGHGAKTVRRAEPYRRLVTRSRGSCGSTRALVSTTASPEAASTGGSSAARSAATESQRS